MQARGIHHLGVAVEDLDEALETYRTLFSAEVEHRQEVPDQGLEAAAVRVGESRVELVASLGEDTPVGRFLAKRGPGMHHVAYEVGDIDLALAACRDAGIQLIDAAPRPGLHEGWRVAFLHPRSCGGVLTELVETGAPWPGTGL